MKKTEDVKSIDEQITHIVKTSSVELYTRIKKGQPKDTSHMLKDWQLIPTKPDDMGFAIVNTVPYSWYIWRGRRQVNGKWYGSLKGWGPIGGQPLVDRMAEEIQRRLDEVEPKGESSD